MNKLDKETQSIMLRQQMMESFIKGEEWGIVKGIIEETIKGVTDISSLENIENPEQLLMEIKARKTLVFLLNGVIKKVEAEGERNDINGGLIDKPAKSHIKILGD